MDGHKGFSTNIASLFEGKNYALWRIRMQTYLMSLVFDILKSVMTSYIAPKHPPTNATWKKRSECNAKAMKAIFCGLSEFEFVKVMHCRPTK